MKATFRLFAAVAVLTTSLASANIVLAAGAAAYEPAPGEEVVIYTHRFKAADFEAGLKLVKDGFTAAQKASGQTRKNDILVDRTNNTVVLISYFGPGSDVETWHTFMGRLDILEKLKPMRSEPLVIERFKLDAVTRAP